MKRCEHSHNDRRSRRLEFPGRWRSARNVRTFLVNGLAIQANQDEAVALVDRVVNDHIDVNGIMSWLAEPGRLISIADASL